MAWADPVSVHFVVALPRQATSLPSPVRLELHTDMPGDTCADWISASLDTVNAVDFNQQFGAANIAVDQ